MNPLSPRLVCQFTALNGRSFQIAVGKQAETTRRQINQGCNDNFN